MNNTMGGRNVTHSYIHTKNFIYHSPKGTLAMTTSKNQKIRRGDIFYIIGDPDQPPVGSEIWSDRAGLIVSNNGTNMASDAVEIVYLSTSENKRISPSHIHVTSGNKKALALCEQIHTVDKSRLTDLIGRATDEEMENITDALLFSLQINTGRNPQGLFHKWENYVRKYNIFSDKKSLSQFAK